MKLPTTCKRCGQEPRRDCPACLGTGSPETAAILREIRQNSPTVTLTGEHLRSAEQLTYTEGAILQEFRRELATKAGKEIVIEVNRFTSGILERLTQ